MRKCTLVFALIAVVAAGAGCPRPKEIDPKEAAQRLSAVYNALDLGGTLASDQVNGVARDQGTVKMDSPNAEINLDYDLDVTVDLDATDFWGVDLYPNATGEMRFQATVELSGSTQTGATITADPIQATCVTDVVVTDPDSGATATLAQGATISYAASGGYTFALPGAYTSFVETAATVQDYNLTATVGDGEGGESTSTLSADASMTTALDYEDEDIWDFQPGWWTYVADGEAQCEWTQDGAAHTAALTVLVDATQEQAVSEIVLTVDGEVIGSFTLEAFREQFEADPTGQQ